MTDEAKTVKLGGRAFRVIERSTAKHDQWVILSLKQAGLDVAVIDEGEDAEAFAQRFIADAMCNPAFFTLVGGLLIDADKSPRDWTPEMAEEIGTFLSGLDDPEDKHFLWVTAGAMFADFFAGGLVSLRTFQKSFPAEPGPRSESVTPAH